MGTELQQLTSVLSSKTDAAQFHKYEALVLEIQSMQSELQQLLEARLADVEQCLEEKLGVTRCSDSIRAISNGEDIEHRRFRDAGSLGTLHQMRINVRNVPPVGTLERGLQICNSETLSP